MCENGRIWMSMACLTLGLLGTQIVAAPPPAETVAEVTGISLGGDPLPGYVPLLFPDGLSKALVMSFDDATIHDRRLVRIFNVYGIRGTFHVPLSTIGMDGYISTNEVKALYAGHEVSVHDGNTHCETNEYRRQILEARSRLEALVGYPVRGLAFVGGDSTPEANATLPSAGIVYARYVGGYDNFDLRTNYIGWGTTCHQGKAPEFVDRFLSYDKRPALFFVWGHSYEFNEGKSWGVIEDFCRRMGGHTDVWYTTCIELADYQQAAQTLKVVQGGRAIENSSQRAVWIEYNGQPVCLAPNKTTLLKDVQARKASRPASGREVPDVWSAYNDVSWGGEQPSENISCFGPGELKEGPLVDYGTGKRLPVTVRFSGGGSFRQEDSAPSRVTPEMPAAKVFGGKLSLDGYVKWDEGTLSLTMTGLDPRRRYEVVLYGSRGGTEEKYRERRLTVRLLGTDTFLEKSSVRAQRSEKGSTLTAADIGECWRFTHIEPGSDGNVEFTMMPSGGAYLNAFMIRVIGPL